MLCTIPSAVVQGVDGHPVSVEVHVSRGLPGYNLVGLPDASCRESRDRVRAAILSSGYKWPHERITINLAPTGLQKSGAGLDFPIALGLLAASDQIRPESLSRFGAVGELGLDGSIRPVAGLVSLAEAVNALEVLVPADGAGQAAVIRPSEVRGVGYLAELVRALEDAGPMPAITEVAEEPLEDLTNSLGDLSEIRGQHFARWALEVAAAGGHHMLMIGPPGAGKTMLAARLPTLLPRLNKEEALEVTRIHSSAGIETSDEVLIRRPPFRAPHHGASMVAMIGGGTAAMRPGEISCAHSGVLFLDELGEFPVAVLDALRQPLEEGVVRVSRAARTATLPARFLLVAAMNPCPCGSGGPGGRCRCSEPARLRYSRRLSGPLLDRFDIRVELSPPPVDDLLSSTPSEPSSQVRARVLRARERSLTRGFRSNSQIPSSLMDELAPLAPDALKLVRTELSAGRLSGRGLHRLRTVALTVSDLTESQGPISYTSIAAALSLRSSPDFLMGLAS